MKNYNKILEAVNRGIQLALDDFDDEEQIQNIKSKQILNRDYTKEYLDLLREEVVDLGLPSRTLWCKYNLGVSPSKLLTPEDWDGDYYAWGELKPNKTNKDGEFYFGWNDYKFGNYNNLTKYCNKPTCGLNGFTDNLTELLPEDDVAYQNKKFYNFKFHIPTKKQCEEIIKYTKNYWVKNYDPNKTIHNHEDDGGIKGLNGRIFEGKNRNQLFIPAVGYCSGSNVYNDRAYCYLWSSSIHLDFPFQAYDVYMDSTNIRVNSSARHNGYSIRPVINL